jgi:hypothetical protein
MLRNDLYRPWFVGETDWGVEFLSGDFRGLAIQIEKMDFGKDQEGKIDFDYHIVHKPDIITKEETSTAQFEALLELVINDILKEAMENYDKTGNDDSKESNT